MTLKLPSRALPRRRALCTISKRPRCSGGTTEVKRATAVGADMLVVAGARAEEVAQLVVGAAKALGGGEALEARILHSVDLVDHFI